MSKVGVVAIIGRPNAGKSTLLNGILKSKLSIVTPKAQTTRDRILGIFTEPEGQIIFMDTPGIHKAKEGGINQFMMTEVKEALDSPNLVWYLVDPFSAPKHEQAVIEMLKGTQSPVCILMNKMDAAARKIPPAQLEAFASTLKDTLANENIPVHQIYQISALKSQGLVALLQDTWALLPEGHALYPDSEQVSDRPTRFFVAEMIREKLYYLLGDELPYSCAIEIEKFEETSKPPRIEAIIHVERESQKGMVIGKGGQKIKEIGQSARLEIENFLGHPIFLGLKVKVLKDWSRRAEDLKKMGYHLPK